MALAGLWLVGVACAPAASRSENAGTSASPEVRFGAHITGSYEGEVSGGGVLVLLPDAGFERQGYYFLADGQGLRPHGVTFVLPRGVTPGKYRLQSPNPLQLGNLASVRVDRDVGGSVRSFDRNTSGILDLTAFPDDEMNRSGTDVAGDFVFETEDSKGQRITVKGRFAFTVP